MHSSSPNMTMHLRNWEAPADLFLADLCPSSTEVPEMMTETLDKQTWCWLPWSKKTLSLILKIHTVLVRMTLWFACFRATRQVEMPVGFFAWSGPVWWRTIHVKLDHPSWVWSLLSKLSKDGCCRCHQWWVWHGLLGAGLYITEYSRWCANVMGFNEFIAKKSVCLILVRITMYILPDGNGHILLRHNEGVYNMRSCLDHSPLQLPALDSQAYCGQYLQGTSWHWLSTRYTTMPRNTGWWWGDRLYDLTTQACDALMNFFISLPSEEDLAMLPIVNITPVDIWCPSNFNEIMGAQFQIVTLDPPTFAQLATRMGPENTLEVFHDAIQDVLFQGTGLNPQPNDGNDNSVFHDAQTNLLPDNGH